MKSSRRLAIVSNFFSTAALVAAISFLTAIAATAEPSVFASPFPIEAAPASSDGQQGKNPSSPASVCEPATLGSPYVPVDNWIYPAMMRLYSLGFLDHVFLDMRPWTRASIAHMLEDTAAKIEDADAGPVTDQAQDIYEAVAHELRYDTAGPCQGLKGNTRVESVYTVARAISGTPLRDSFHMGSTIINDYGRPFAGGFNSYTGASGYATAGRFALYARGEFQAAPSTTGYSQALAQRLSNIDNTTFINPVTGLPFNQATIPMGSIGSTANGRWMEAYASALVLNHEISIGKHDEWLGPAVGGSFAYSNNAENIYSFDINRVEPLHIQACLM